MDPFLSEIRLFASNFAPIGWAVCNGATLPISQNTALFTLIGTMYGGDGVSTFALPDLRGKTPFSSGEGVAYCIAVQGVYPSRNRPVSNSTGPCHRSGERPNRLKRLEARVGIEGMPYPSDQPHP